MILISELHRDEGTRKRQERKVRERVTHYGLNDIGLSDHQIIFGQKKS